MDNNKKIIIAVIFVSIVGVILYQNVPRTANDYYRRGLDNYNKGNYERAIENYSRAIQINGNFFNAYSGRAEAYSKIGNNRNAIADYTTMISLNPNDSEAYLVRAILYRDQGDLNRAIADFSQVINLTNSEIRLSIAYRNRGQAYFEQGDFNRAIADYIEYLNIYPDSEEIRENLRIARYNQRQREIAGYTEAIRQNPNNADAYFRRGYVHYMNIAHIDISNLNEFQRTLVGMLMSVDLDQAISDWERTLRINPNHREARDLLARARALRRSFP